MAIPRKDKKPAMSVMVVKIIEDEIEYLQGFLNSVMKKLDNEKFVQNAPEKVVEMEKKKLADAEARIVAIEKALAVLNGK